MLIFQETQNERTNERVGVTLFSRSRIDFQPVTELAEPGKRSRPPLDRILPSPLSSVFFFLLTRIHKFLPPYGKEIRVSTRGASTTL